MGTREKNLTNYIFLERLNYPSLICPPPRKLKHKLHNSNKLIENNTLTTKQPLTKILIKKKSSYKNYTSYKFQMLLDKTRTYNQYKKNFDLNIFFKEINMGFKYLWISAPKLLKAEQLFVADDKRGLEMGASAKRGSWSGVEAIPISCLSSIWF